MTNNFCCVICIRVSCQLIFNSYQNPYKLNLSLFKTLLLSYTLQKWSITDIFSIKKNSNLGKWLGIWKYKAACNIFIPWRSCKPVHLLQTPCLTALVSYNAKYNTMFDHYRTHTHTQWPNNFKIHMMTHIWMHCKPK